MAAGNSYCLGIKSNDFFLKDNKKAFILWLNVPKVTAYPYTSRRLNLASKGESVKMSFDATNVFYFIDAFNGIFHHEIDGFLFLSTQWLILFQELFGKHPIVMLSIEC